MLRQDNGGACWGGQVEAQDRFRPALFKGTTVDPKTFDNQSRVEGRGSTIDKFEVREEIVAVMNGKRISSSSSSS